MTRPEEATPSLLARAHRLDVALYERVAGHDTPRLDPLLRRLSDTANHSKISLALAGALAVAGGAQGRRSAVRGVVAIAATSLLVNAVLKPLSARARPDVEDPGADHPRRLPMPVSHSFPSGHSASAFAFAAAAGSGRPRLAAPLFVVAAAVGYSRVHTGVHFPGDVLAGAGAGVAIAEVTVRILDRAWPASL